MTVRLPTDLLVGALLRRVQNAGGNATVLAKGDKSGGAILIVCAEKGLVHTILERVPDNNGHYIWIPCGPKNCANIQEYKDYLDRRRSRDPDIWILELDIAEAERFAAETINQA